MLLRSVLLIHTLVGRPAMYRSTMTELEWQGAKWSESELDLVPIMDENDVYVNGSRTVGRFFADPFRLNQWMKMNSDVELIEEDAMGNLPPIHFKSGSPSMDITARAACLPISTEFPNDITENESAGLNCTIDAQVSSVCNIENTNIPFETAHIQCVCAYRIFGPIIMPTCNWRRLVLDDETTTMPDLSSTSTSTSTSLTTTAESATTKITTVSTTTTNLPTTQSSTISSTSTSTVTEESTTVTTNSGPTVHSSTQLPDSPTTMNHPNCGRIDAPRNGFLYCPSPSVCSLRCNDGYVPRTILPTGAGESSLQICYEGTRAWTDAPYDDCVPFDDFCQFNTTAIQNDPYAIVHVSYGSVLCGREPHIKRQVIGKYEVDARCKSINYKFSRIDDNCKKARCQCKRRHMTYYCIRTVDSLDFGPCELDQQMISDTLL